MAKTKRNTRAQPTTLKSPDKMALATTKPTLSMTNKWNNTNYTNKISCANCERTEKKTTNVGSHVK